jgi:hypothetical protein
VTDNPLGPVTFTAEEKAMLAGTAEVKLEETDGDALPEGGAPSDEHKPTPEQSGDAADGDKPADEGDPDGDEEVTEVADGTNPDGPVRRKVIAFSASEKLRQG